MMGSSLDLSTSSMIAFQASSLESKYGLRLQLNGVSNSRRMLVKPEGIDPTSWKEAFDVQVNAVHQVTVLCCDIPIVQHL